VPHSNKTEIAIIGAGPYGLSIAAHLRSSGVDFRIFGTPMQLWQAHMPKGMFLKSEGRASNLFDPTGSYTLEHYCADHGAPYEGWGKAVSRELFAQYAMSFQRRFVPMVEDVMVTSLDHSSGQYDLQLASGETVSASKVVVATGMSYTAHIPAALSQVPGRLVSHSESQCDLLEFKGREVTVLGGGQSALETAALLHETGVKVRLVLRKPTVVWNGDPIRGSRSLYQSLRRPMSSLGMGLGPWLYSNAPMLFRYLPQQTRFERVRKALGPAGAWWLKDRVMGRFPIMAGYSVEGAEARGEQVQLQLQDSNGQPATLITDHVIAATGYRFALAALPFLRKNLLSQIRCVQETPVLSSNFESSVPGLYFTGLAAANQFGPAMRFLYGAGFTSRCVSRHIVGHRSALLVSNVAKRATEYQKF